MDFLLEPKVGIISMVPSSYRPEQNFELKDLDLNKVIQLYTQKHKMFVPAELYKVLLKYPEFAQQVNFRVTPIDEDDEANLIRLHPEMKSLIRRL
jgi:hypothetical protein